MWVYDKITEKATIFAEHIQAELRLPVQVAPTLMQAVRHADIVVTATWSRSPFLFAPLIQPGTHITTLGPDEPGKCEVAADLLQKGVFVCDDRELAVTMGALGGVGLGRDAVHAELGEILGGMRSGRTRADQITIYGGVGLAFQDLVACWHVFREAQRDERRTFDFFS